MAAAAVLRACEARTGIVTTKNTGIVLVRYEWIRWKPNTAVRCGTVPYSFYCDLHPYRILLSSLVSISSFFL